MKVSKNPSHYATIDVTSLFIACSFDLPDLIPHHAAGGVIQADYINKKGRTALQVAVEHGSCGVVSSLLADRLIHITEEVFKAAAGNRESGEEVMTLLLDRRGADVPI